MTIEAIHPSPTVPPTKSATLRRWTAKEYLRLAHLGFFNGQRVELIAGRIIKMSPIYNAHAAVVTRLTRYFSVLPEERFWVRTQATLHLFSNLPEPDLAVVSGPLSTAGTFPTSALLVIEVSDSTLRFDRGVKLSLYAKAAIPEYWIVNLNDCSVECLANPARLAKASIYGQRVLKRGDELLSPACFPELHFPVAALFK
mgnify:CR=1 FL=1